MSKLRSLFSSLISFFRTKWGIATGILIISILGYMLTHRGTSKFTYVTVTQGSIIETVSVTGNTTPIQSVSLAFQNSGTVARTYAKVGDHVSAGSLLASLDTSDLSAQLRQAQANVDAQNAKLQGLKDGARPEDISASQASFAKAGQDLTNMYAGIPDTLNDSYSKANDAVRVQVNNLFSNPDNNSVQVTFNSTNSQAVSDAKSQRNAVGIMLGTWQNDIITTSVTASPTDLETVLSHSLANLASVRLMLIRLSATLDGAVNLDATTLATYKAGVTTALTEVNTATKNLNTISQNIASQKLIVAQAKAQLDLKQAGSSASDILAQTAQVEQAQASVASIEAKIHSSQIITPIDGVVTQFDAKVGQIASPSLALVSVISSSSFEVDAQVPETDVGKIAVNNPVSMTFDAFPGETFTGTLFYIDPAQTVNQGVIDYKIKVSFKTSDPRIKSGLTANLDIHTKEKDGALILPQYAVLQNDSGTFVQTVVGGKATSSPVTIGIQDQNGNVEIVSGVTVGEQVLNIGLKQ